jgi:predicted transporter
LAFLVTIAFLCAAAFVYVLQNYGPIQACLTGAGIFLAIALIGIGVYTVRKRQARQEAKETAKSALHTALADPVMMATALQVVRAIGIKKLVPILAVGGLALGLLANRPASHEAPAE